MPDMIDRCWCGSQDFRAFSPHYRQCTACDTLVTNAAIDPHRAIVTDDAHDFYGQRYWYEHQAQHLHHDNITVRARDDLSDRVLYWLHYLLKYRLPPAQVLELGSGHGGFVALMQAAGYTATGLELSPSIVEYARTTFDIPVLLGPLETQMLDDGSFDVIVLFDVLEHLHDPVITLQHCARLLKPEGFLLIQTPCLPDDLSYDDMQAYDSPFLSMLLPDEHIYLLSETGLCRLMQMVGLTHIAFEPARFAAYDTFFVASRTELVPHATAEIDHALTQSAGQRIVHAMLNVDQKARHLNTTVDRLVADDDVRRKQSTTLFIRYRHLVARISSSRAYRVWRWLGRWQHHADLLEQLSDDFEQLVYDVVDAPPTLRRVAVDLTPVRPGGINGGAKPLALAIIQGLSHRYPDCEWVLLTARDTHDQLAVLDSDHVRRVCIYESDAQPEPDHPATIPRHHAIRRRLGALLPGVIAVQAINWYRKRTYHSFASGIFETEHFDVLYCPFTTPTTYDPSVPLVAHVHDVQYRIYPNFFSPQEWQERERNMALTIQLADKIVCVSNTVRSTMLENFDVKAQDVITVYSRIAQRHHQPSDTFMRQTLARLQLIPDNYLIYPANCWQHKNHKMLLVAFGMYRQQNPQSALRLVCTGTPFTLCEQLAHDVTTMGLRDWVTFTGFLPDDEFAACMMGARALIFPSLYEGFGLPVVEAMVMGKPVLCSNLAALPEVAGEAALYFDPRKPQSIVNALVRLESEPAVVQELVQRGYQQAAPFSATDVMIDALFAIMEQAVTPKHASGITLSGVFGDGWTADRIRVRSGGHAGVGATLRLVIDVPPDLPSSRLFVTVIIDRQHFETRLIGKGHQREFRISLDDISVIEFVLYPVFQPLAQGINDDPRLLGGRCTICQIIAANDTLIHDLLKSNDDA